MPYYGDALPYYYGGPFSNHSSLMTGTGRTIHSPLGSSRYAPHLSTISESPLSALRRYSPAASATTTAMSSRPKRVIDTADIDVSTPRALSRPDGGGGHRNRLRRDRPTIRIRSQALKDNPALREHYERHEKTVGELLVEKFLIKDKKPDGGVGDAQDAVVRPKLYTQVSLERAAAAAAAATASTTTTTTDDTNNNHDRDELHEAMQKRVTRRMTRRRSSADVQMDPEQLEREVLIALAQADALDELVAEEQAEIEVETRMGTLIRKNLVRAAPSVLGKHESQSGGVEDDDETRTARKLAKKVKKRRKTTDKPSPPSESEWESEADARKPRTARDKVSGSVGQDGGGSVGQDGGGSNGQDGVRSIDVSQDGGGEQNDDSPGTTGKALKFKVEASNSVGDFSTLWINAGAAEERENQRKASQAIVEQFRDSVRLPAPKAAARLARPDRNKDVIVEEHQQVVVLPVRKRYVKDDSRNSVYLTLKTPKNGVAAAAAARPDDSVGNCGDGSPGGADYERLTSLSNGSQSRAEKVAKFRSKDIAESDAEVGSISESSAAGRVEGPGERWTKDGAFDDDEPDEKSISSSGIRDEASGILDDRDPRRRAAADDVDASTIARPTSDESSRDLGKFRKAASGEKLTERARDVGIVESPARNKDPRSPIGGRKDEVSGKNIGITAEQKRTKSGVGALDSASAKPETRFARNASDGRAKTGETNADDIEGVSSVAATRIVDESLPNASTIKSLDARVELGQLPQDQAVKIRGGESDGFSHEGEKLGATGNSEASNEDQPGFSRILAKNCEAETPKNKSKLAIQDDESPETPGRNGHFFKFDEDSTEVDGKDAADASRVRNGREVLGKLSSLGGNDVDEVRTEYPDLKVVPDSPRKVGFQLKKRAIATANGEKSAPQSPVEKSDSAIDLKKKLKREKDTENLVEKKIPESPKSNGLKSPLQSPVEKSDSSIDAKRKLKCEKDTENLVEKKLPESPKSNGLKSPLQSPVEKSDSSIDAKTKLKREKDTEKTAENLVEKKLPESPKSNGLTSPLQSPVEKSDSSINAKTKLKREKDTEKTAENLIDKKLPESAKTSDDSAKLTNGVSKLKLRPIEEIRENRELAKAEKPKLRIWNKPDTPPIQEDDGIDFWGEIASQRVAKPAARARIEPTEIAEVPKILVAERNAINSEPEVKPNPPSESGTPVVQKESESLATEERKPGKARKKKTTESGACKKKDQEKASAETISERVISVEGGDEETPRQQPSGKSSESETSEEKSRGSHEADRFERNLSTIAEESSPVSEELPRIRDLASSIPSTREKSSDTRPEPSRVLVPEKPVKTASTVASDIVEPEATSPVTDGKIIVATAAEISGNSVEPEAASSSPSSPFTESSVPTINIVEAPSTPPDQEPPELREDQPEEATQEDEQEGPGTPTNEAADETPNNITKWTGRSDLSLDEPDKDVVPEAAPGTKKDSAKKKTSTKKKVSKKGSKSSSNSVNTPGASPDSSKTKKLAKRKKSSTKTGKESDKRSIFERESKISVSSDTTLKPGGLNLRNSPKNSPRNTPKQRPLDLIKMFYTTPASLLTATPRDLSKVRRAKIKKKKHSTRTASASSDSTGSTRSTQSTGTAESTGSTEHEDDAEQKRISSTRSNDSGFDGSPRLSTPSQSSDNQRNSDGSDHHHASGRITPPATNLPRFKKYTVMDFNFLKVLGKGSFGKVLLAELRRTDCVYAVKCLKKDVVLEDDDVECTLIERKVLTLATRHPYLCHLFCTFQTDSHLFFVMEYLNGGDLMFHIQKSGRFAESRARFYAAEIWSGLNFLHKKGIVYRDLKLDNVLLDFEGHIRIADFGMCKLQIFLDRTADTFCGTPDYMAPEIIKGLKYNQAVDWWSFGVLLYEMLTGQSPFSGCDEDELFWSICNERPFIPRYLSQEAMDVLVCLLEKDAGKRPLAHDISVHPFFHSTQWDRLERRQLEPPFKPALEHTLDTRYFDTAFTAERPRLTPVPEQILTSMDQGVFRGFSYTNPNATD